MTYLKVLEEIRQAAMEHVTLVAVTKGRSMEDVMALYSQGQRDFGENRIQEALEKIEQAPQDCRWHLIGTLQKNKVRKAVGKFVLIHSVDSLGLLEQISKCSAEIGVTTHVLLQVNTSGETSKHGFTPQECLQEFPEILKRKNVKIEGLMTMAPLTDDEKVILTCFAALRHLKGRLNKAYPQADIKHLSMGMSHDFKIALQEGATIIRVGTALFSPLN